MSFSSTPFLFIFLPFTFLFYIGCSRLENQFPDKKTPRLSRWVLLFCSLIFYAYGEPFFIFILIASVYANYLASIFLVKMKRRRMQKGLLILILIADLGILIFYKYLSFFTKIILYFFKISIPVPDIPLPIGISFFTFQMVSYVIDVYRNPEMIQRNYFNVLLYISFFPQLIAGPIVKYHDFCPYLSRYKISVNEITAGINVFIIGLFKKVCFADACGMITDCLYAQVDIGISTEAAWLAAVSYTLQIYFDFSGYSDMAIGMGHMFGFTFPKNFSYPYSSCSIKEFWQKWHISLSLWFREYVYIPLGGNRKGKLREVSNKLVVFFLTGLWHGANTTFILWGMIHGICNALESIFLTKKETTYLEQSQAAPKTRGCRLITRFFGWFYTMFIVITAFVFFRSETITQGIHWIASMFSFHRKTIEEQNILADIMNPCYQYIFVLSIFFVFPCWRDIWKKMNQQKSMHAVLTGLKYLLLFMMLVLSCAAIAGTSFHPFIYFQF